MTLIRNSFFDELALALKDQGASNTLIKSISELCTRNCPTFRPDKFLAHAGYVSPAERILKLGQRTKVVPLHRSPESEDHE